jgi:methyl-accepting chemotaxis protein
LLALNAAIEAARAGEHGRGFAVVAEEVRKLAEQSASAAKEIYLLINAIQSESEKAVDSMADGSREVKSGLEVVREVGSNFKEIITAVQGLSSQIQNVASATEQMAAGVQNVAASTEEQTATMEEISAATESLTIMSEELNALVERFKV